MGIYARTMIFARRLWVFYLLIVIFSVFFGVFYYRYLPGNEAEIDTRGFRILNQLASNITERDATLADAFNNAACSFCSANLRLAVLNQIHQNIPFDTTYYETSTIAKQHLRRLDTIDSKGWCMNYVVPPDKKPDTLPLMASVRIANFLAPILAARTDLFDSYMLLRWNAGDTGNMPARTSTRNNQFRIIYLQHSLSASYGFSADSALSLQKNTDLADITTISLGGEAYNLFFQPFEFAGDRLVLCGLISKGDYDHQVKSLPSNFVAGMILTILLGLLGLPFIKVFFISPREHVRKWDALKIALGLYLGTAILILAGIYFLANFCALNEVKGNLRTISDKIAQDIRQDLDAASGQLQNYAGEYKKLNAFSGVIAYRDPLDAHQDSVNRIFSPFTYPLVSRILWVDSLGETMAKWNPFTFISPPSSATGYNYFTQLQQKNPDDPSLVLSAGQSNITSEFQMYLARRLVESIDACRPQHVDNGSPVPDKNYANSFGSVLAFYLHSGLRPVLPRGYGFCLVDNRTLSVLMHSDARRNLSENLYLETGSNGTLKNIIEHKEVAYIYDLDLYGSPHTFYIQPVAGRQISLVVFYDEGTHTANILRLIHFGGETLLYMALLFLTCLFLSTVQVGNPSKLSFTIDPVEWIRPRKRNHRSYRCTREYFLDLTWLSVCFFLLIRFAGLDIRIAFYTGLLLPSYVLWGFIASRRKEKTRFPEEAPIPGAAGAPAPPTYWLPRVFTDAKTMVITLVLLNLLIYRLIKRQPGDHHWAIFIYLYLFELLATAALLLRYAKAFRLPVPFLPVKTSPVSPRAQAADVLPEKPGYKNNYIIAYVQSLYYSVLVITVIPALCVLWYAWSVEKIQYTRSDQLSIMVQNEEHLRYNAHLLHQYWPDVRQRLDSGLHFKDSLLYSNGRYFAGERLDHLPDGYCGGVSSPTDAPDEPYITLLDQVFLITAGEYSSYSVGTNAADASWFFQSTRQDEISLTRPMTQDFPPRRGEGADPLFKDFQVTSPLQGALFSLNGLTVFHWAFFLLVLTIFLWGLPRLLHLTVQRLFLLQFLSHRPPVEHKILENYFPDGKFPPADFLVEADTRLPLEEQEEYIMRTMLENKPAFQKIWADLPLSERYFIYDFSLDGYSNYRDFKLIYVLLEKGLLQNHGDKWALFAISFREYVLQKKGSREIARLKTRFSAPGLWSTIRIPALIIIAACAVLLLMTQDSVSHRVTVMITSAGAIVPVILEITKRIASKGPG